MALPTLQPYYKRQTARTSAEQLIVRRRTHEDHVKQTWAENSKYFNISNVRASKQDAWVSSKSLQGRMDSSRLREKKEEKRKLLQERREKLSRLLEEENKIYETELQAKSSTQFSSVKERVDHLKSRREQERKSIAQQKTYEHWRSNCPDLRQVQSREMQKFVVDEWGKQVDQKQKDIESERKEKERYESELEQQRLAALKAQEEEELIHKHQHKEYGEVLKAQMREIRRKEEQAAFLEQQQAQLVQDQLVLQRAEESRRQMEEKQKKTELRRLLIHQCKAQLRRKSQQIQESLALDLALLEDLAEKEKSDQVLQTARKEKAHADAVWMKEVMSKQLVIEKQREMELDNLYREEAAKLWHKREAEWERERLARGKLMTEVFDERQQQITKKIDVLKEEQTRSVLEREKLFQEMELEMQKQETEELDRKQRTDRRARDLQQQMLDKNKKTAIAQLHHQRELEEQRMSDKDYMAQVQDEQARITARGYDPQMQVHSKQRFAWY